MPQPLLSIGMIVKNEERCLERSLKALEPLRQTIPCELVIADTGSTDKTVDIAKKYADKLINLKWNNNFAEARNSVLDHCSGKWHLYIDADEYLSDGVSQLTTFLKSSAEKEKSFASIVIRNHSIPQMNGTYADFNSLRLFKTKPGRRFIGSIHEYVPYTTPDECCILTDVIFDHDGYTQVTPKHLKEKEERNLKILEKDLYKKPTDIRTIIQCLEASTNNEKKRRFYTEYALNFFKNSTHDDSNWAILAPLCAFRVIAYLIQDHHSLIEEFFEWSLKEFGYSQYILVDAFFIYIKHLYQKQDFDSVIIYAKKYFENLKKYEESKHIVSQSSFINPVIFCNIYAQNEIKTIIGSSLLETGCAEDALYYLENMELNLCDNETIKLWLKTVIECNNNTIHIKCKNSIYEILKNHQKNTDYNSAYTCINETFFDYLSCLNNNPHCFFKDFELDIGLSYKIANSKTKECAERYLSEIENPKELMPIALKQALVLRCDLPDNFLSLPFEHLTKVFNNLSIVTNEISDALIEKYLITNTTHTFPYFSFFFNLSSTLLFNQNSNSYNKNTLVLLSKYLTLADKYLNICYTNTILGNEDFVSRLPENHLVTWYLLKANKEKNTNPLEYIKILRTALQKVPQAKQIIEFLIEDFKNEEEAKRQEQIKTASPELVAMAEQLKTMLKAFPPNSPELLAIKQSPMYKQVAFLIED